MAIDYRAYARQAAARAGIDPNIFERQIDQESGFRVDAGSSAGAQGIAQFMPGTARGEGVDPWNPTQALDGAARMMARYLKQFGNYSMALAAYNAGPGAVQQYGAVPPYKETQTYVNNILNGIGDKVAGLGATTASAAGPEGDPIDSILGQMDAENAAKTAADPYPTWGNPRPNTQGTPAANAQPQQTGYLAQIEAKKGPGQRVATSQPTVMDDVTGLQVPNPNPVYRVTWPDGTYANVTAKDEVIGGNALADISKGTTTAKLSRFTGPDGYSYTFDPNTGETVRDESVGTAAPKADTSPPSIVSVGGKAFKWQKGRDAAWALYPVAELNDPNYQPPGYRTPAQQAQDAATLTSTNLANQNYRPPGYRTPAQQAQDSATLTGTNINNQQGQLAILKAQAQAKSDELWKQVSTGQMRPQDAISNFDEWWKINAEAPQFKANLVSTITSQQKELASYQVGPQFGEHFAQALNDQTAPGGGSGKTNFTGADFTFKMEDPSKIAERMTLQALAGISPLAAQRLAKMGGGGGQTSTGGSPQQDYGASSYTPPAPQLSTVEPVKFPNYVPEPVRAAQGLMAGGGSNYPAPLPYAGPGGDYQDDPMLTPEQNMQRRYAQLSPYLPGG